MKDDRGSASVVVAAVMAALVTLAMGAADAAALAAVHEQAIPSGVEPSDLAAEYSARNGAELTACECDAGAFESLVSVRVPVGPLFLFPDDRVVVGEARAVVDLPT